MRPAVAVRVLLSGRFSHCGEPTVNCRRGDRIERSCCPTREPPLVPGEARDLPSARCASGIAGAIREPESRLFSRKFYVSE